MVYELMVFENYVYGVFLEEYLMRRVKGFGICVNWEVDRYFC